MPRFRNIKANRNAASRRKQPTRRSTPYLAPEAREQRRLMAADAFDFQTFDDPNSQAVVAEMYETVDELATIVQRGTNPFEVQLFLEQGQPELLFENVDPNQWRAIVDSAEIPNLGPAIGQAPQLGQSLNDMVIMELLGIPDQAPEYTQQMNFFLNELDCQLNIFIDIPQTVDGLPPQFEQLRQELGDEAFAEWLQQNRQETGTLSGITEDVIGELDPRAIQQLDQEEAALHNWLQHYLESNAPLEIPEPYEVLRVELGDEWFDLWLNSNANLFGNLSGLPEPELIVLEVVDPGLEHFQLQEQALEAWLRDVGDHLAWPVDITDVDVPARFTDDLPTEYEQLRLTLGNEAFAEWLQANRDQFGNLLGVQDPAWITDEVAETEAQLRDWLDAYQNPQVEFEVVGDTDGDGAVAFNDFLTLSTNFGTTVDLGYLAGDFDLDGTVAFSDFLVLSSNFGTTTISCG